MFYFNEAIDFRDIYHPIVDKHKVDFILQSHYHLYERTFLLLLTMMMTNILNKTIMPMSA